MTLSESIIMSNFEIVFYLLVAGKLTGRTSSIKNRIIAVLIGGLLVGVISETLTEPYGTVLAGLIFFPIIASVYRIKLVIAFKAYLLSTVLIMVIQLLSLIPIAVIMGGVEYNFSNGLISQIITVVLVYTMCKFIPINNIMYFIDRRDKLFTYVIANAFVIMTLLIVYWKIDIEGIVENLIGISVLSFTLVTVNLVIIKKGFENKKAEELLEIHEKYMPVYEQLVETIRKKQHDFNNHINAINMIIETSDGFDEARSKVETYTGEVLGSMPSELMILENAVVAGFLYSKILEAESKHINLELNIRIDNLSKVLMDSQWVEVLGILLDNAIEASEKDSNIYLSMEKESKSLITVKNQHEYMNMNVINECFEKGFSTKANNRGFGLFSLKKTVDECNGRIEFLNETINNMNYVVFKVMIP